MGYIKHEPRWSVVVVAQDGQRGEQDQEEVIPRSQVPDGSLEKAKKSKSYP